ncbi:MAG TPA: metal-dependent hydrolase [Polyangia bacterium]|jgi:inner membrane protein|nr:metal-dependent hydrolase [Polyangia bacterium]
MACFGHVAVGLMAGRLHDQGRPVPTDTRGRAAMLIGFGVLGTLPDFDVFAVALGASEATAAGHRGASHSLLTALALAVAGGLLARRYGWSGLRTALALMLAVGSHGLLDTLAEGGRAIPLFWPLTEHRFAAPWRCFPDAPRGFAFLSWHGFSVAALEFLYFLPITAFALWPRSKWRPPRLQVLDGGAERQLARAARAETTDLPAPSAVGRRRNRDLSDDDDERSEPPSPPLRSIG